MIRSLAPYMTVAFVVLAVGAFRFGDSSVFGVYATLVVAVAITAIGGVRWEERQHGRPPRRR